MKTRFMLYREFLKIWKTIVASKVPAFKRDYVIYLVENMAKNFDQGMENYAKNQVQEYARLLATRCARANAASAKNSIVEN